MSEPRMRDLPMLDTDRERLRDEIEGFDDLTPDEFRAAVKERMDGLLDFVNELDAARAPKPATMVYKRCDTCGALMRHEPEEVQCVRYRVRARPKAEGGGWEQLGKCTGTLVVDEGCHAVIFHGPGHQSTTRCQETGEHELHRAVFGSACQEGWWRGMETCTGYFDDPPPLED